MARMNLNDLPSATLNHITCLSAAGRHQMAYWDWVGPQGAQTVLCVHGLTRNGRDFDALAAQLSKQYRVICVDVVGRGKSDWLRNPMLYAFPQYITDIMTLVSQLNLRKIKWVGTSMGGLIGMVIAATPNNPIDTLVLNDVGPVLAPEGVARIGTYVGVQPQYKTYREAADALIAASSTFGKHTPEQWEIFTRHYLIERNGHWQTNYDPDISAPFRASINQTMDLWPLYDTIRIPVQLIRGADSDLLSTQTALEMTQRGPRAELSTIANVGHAPTLIAEDQVALITTFLAKH
jgi:pimeloyl-ACP methyl ester carboxylesterase